MNNNNSNLGALVFIPDANKAVLSIRTYGLPEKRAEELIAKETEFATTEYRIIPQSAITPILLELFGDQHVEMALELVYFLKYDLEIEFESIFEHLRKYLKDNTPEMTIRYPDLLRKYIIENKNSLESNED